MKRLTIRQALVATLVTTLIYRQGVDQIFFGGDYMIFRGYGRRSVVTNKVYRGGHKNITQPYGRIRYKQGPLTLFTIFNGANNEYIANQIAAPVMGRWEI